MLPACPPPVEMITAGGHKIRVRGLSRGEVLAVAAAGSERDAEILGLAAGLDCSVAEAEAWLDATAAPVASAVSAAIARLSGMGPGKEGS